MAELAIEVLDAAEGMKVDKASWVSFFQRLTLLLLADLFLPETTSFFAYNSGQSLTVVRCASDLYPSSSYIL